MKIEKFGQGEPRFNIIVGIHGNETAPVKGFILLKKYIEDKNIKKAFCVIITNEKAFKANKRFIKVDLNRCFPGNPKGCYEERLANQLMVETSKAEFNFDFHSTSTSIDKPYGIVSIYNKKVHKIMAATGIKNYIFDSNESLIKFATNSLAFEVGCERDHRSPDNAFMIMKNILINFNAINEKIKFKHYLPNIYLIYHFIPRSKFLSLNDKLIDFEYVEKGETIGRLKNKKLLIASEGFYPISVKDKIAIKKAKRITIKE